MIRHHIPIGLFFFLGHLFIFNGVAQTTISKTKNAWTLMVDGNPFEVKGVTFGYDQNVANYDEYFRDLQTAGVNTIRIWATNEYTSRLLDAAQHYGIKVLVGIWMRHGRPGMENDDHFNYLEDKEGIEAMYRNAMDVVEHYKGHPAVLSWAIGNEVYLNTATAAEKEAYSLLLERIGSTIKKRDPHHLITSVEAWTFGLDWWQRFVPSIDIYGLNCYGSGANILQDELLKRNIDKPYIITEFGVTGEWDAPEDQNGVTIEPDDQQKYRAITKGYTDWISNKSACLGVYFFHYADGDQFIAPWLFTHYKGMYRPQYWAIRKAYTGQAPDNQIPVINTFKLPDVKTASGHWISVTLETFDPENEALTVSFAYNQRTGSRKRRDQINTLAYRGNLKEGFEILLPQEDGPIKVYVTVTDTYNNAGMASTSIVVTDKEASTKKYLVPKMDLPFYVYQDNENLPYTPSGHMGNYKAIDVDLNHQEEVHSGNTAIKISYSSRNDWYGVGFVDPANDWGDILGGYDISGATTFSFWAKANDHNIKATIGFGLIDKDKPFPDTSKKSKEIVLHTEWKKYTIKIKKMDLSCIRSGLVIFSSSHGFPQDIYIDDVVFE